MALETCFQWFAKDGKAPKGWPIKPNDVPDDLQFNCRIDVDLPQDKMEMANVSGMLVDKGLTDRNWVRQNILNVEETKSMDEKIATDRFFEGMVAAYMEAQVPLMVKQLTTQGQPPDESKNSVVQPIPEGMGPEQIPGPNMGAQAQNEKMAAEQQAQMAQEGNIPSEAALGGQGMNPALGGNSPVVGGMDLSPIKGR
jgi:hypothetical protein